MITITYYLDVVSSWCLYAESTWAALHRDHPEATFDWKITLIPPAGLPATPEEEAGYYRRSGTVVRWPEMLNPGWVESGRNEYVAPNAVAEAARQLGFVDDRVRLAIARAAQLEGRKVGQWEVSVEAACAAVEELDADKLLSTAQSDALLERIQASTREFEALKITQRPTFVLESEIGDRAIFSGLIQKAPLASTIEAMLHDVRAYRSFHAHFGQPTAG